MITTTKDHFTAKILCLLALVCALGASACVGGRNWPKGKALYTGSKLKIKKQGNKASIGELKTQAREIIATPKPNRRFFGFRAGVGRYHLFPQGSWAQRRLAHQPVFFDVEQVKRTENALLNAAKHNGWLDAQVTSRVRWDRRHLRGKVRYRIELAGNPYRLAQFQLPSAENQLAAQLRTKAEERLSPKAGDVYQLNDWIAYRQELVRQARNQGFYFLSAEHLQFVVDSVQSDKTLAFQLSIKPDAPANALIPWQIGEVHIYPNYQLQASDTSETVLSLDGMLVHKRAGEVLRNQLLQRAVSFRPGDLYSEQIQANTVTQLHHLRVFSSIQIKFEPMQDSGKLRCSILLTPYLPQTVEVAASGVTANNLYNGAEVGLRYINRNLARGGEVFQVKPNYAYLFLLGDESGSRLRTFDIQTNLQRPFFLKNRRKEVQTPVYLLGGDMSYQNSLYVLPKDEDGLRLKFGLNEIKAEAGFTRRPVRNTYWTQEFKPIAASMQFTRLHPRELNGLIDELILEDTSFLTFATQLSYAPRVVLAYDNRFRENALATHYFRQMFRFRSGGYLLSDRVAAAVGKSNITQFTTETDARIYQKLRPRLTLAGRFVGNFALPLANSNPLGFPISDLYSAGGSNGLRSFALRSLGPGTWSGQTDSSTLGIVRSNGNMLLQFNSELRYRRKNLETALFADIGNSWNTYASAAFPGGQFRLSKFHRELGFGSGLGLRYFYSLLVFRLDMGYALHDPSRPFGERWISDFGLDRLRFAFAFGQAF